MIQVGEKWIRDTILYYSEFRTISSIDLGSRPTNTLVEKPPQSVFSLPKFPNSFFYGYHIHGWDDAVSWLVVCMYMYMYNTQHKSEKCDLNATKNQNSLTKGVWFWIDVNTPLSAPYHTQTAHGGASKPSTHTTGTQLPIESNPQRTRRPP